MSKEIVLNRLYDGQQIFKVEPLGIKRKWMTESRKQFAYKCLPLNIANSYGFAVYSPADFTITWWGGKEAPSIEIDSPDPEMHETILSYFGESVFTVHLDFIVKTPENYSIYIRGVPNQMERGFIPLDAIVETDWLPFTFTYNFMLVEPGIYEFKKNEPLFIFFPIERNTVENFKLVDRSIEEDPEMLEDFREYAKISKDRAEKSYHPRLYLNGRGPNKVFKIKNHIKKLIFGGKHDKIEE